MSWRDGFLSVASSENMAQCRDDASVSLLPNMRVILLCQGDGTKNLQKCTWYNCNVSGIIYLVQCILYKIPVTCKSCSILRVMPLYARVKVQSCNHRKDSDITRTFCKTQPPNVSKMMIYTLTQHASLRFQKKDLPKVARRLINSTEFRYQLRFYICLSLTKHFPKRNIFLFHFGQVDTFSD